MVAKETCSMETKKGGWEIKLFTYTNLTIENIRTELFFRKKKKSTYCFIIVRYETLTSVVCEVQNLANLSMPTDLCYAIFWFAESSFRNSFPHQLFANFLKLSFI